MTRPIKPAPAARVVTAALLASALGACEVRRDAPEEAEPTPTDTTNPIDTPSEVPSAGGASIIREEIVETATPTPEPPEPLDVVLPFPDGTDISPDAEELLELVLQSDAVRAGWPIVLAGHTDSVGNDQANLRASRSRAENVAAWLIERGIANERIKVIAFGEQNPLVPNAKPDGTPDEVARRRNRRVELTVAAPVDKSQTTANEGDTTKEP
ncbi:OmpA family protein [Aurantiacibacter suaedae]|uniref:OmpA family protein n=1 Tax=Aurantiacibacter suaedae TaxID=2545755 RepID=UPI0010F97892|nr:OmpA family protein [Aurantiacibacter suaedae]